MEMGASAWPGAQARPRGDMPNAQARPTGEVIEIVLGTAQLLTREATYSRAQTPGTFPRLLSVPSQSYVLP